MNPEQMYTNGTCFSFSGTLIGTPEQNFVFIFFSLLCMQTSHTSSSLELKLCLKVELIKNVCTAFSLKCANTRRYNQLCYKNYFLLRTSLKGISYTQSETQLMLLLV